MGVWEGSARCVHERAAQPCMQQSWWLPSRPSRILPRLFQGGTVAPSRPAPPTCGHGGAGVRARRQHEAVALKYADVGQGQHAQRVVAMDVDSRVVAHQLGLHARQQRRQHLPQHLSMR